MSTTAINSLSITKVFISDSPRPKTPGSILEIIEGHRKYLVAEIAGADPNTMQKLSASYEKRSPGSDTYVPVQGTELEKAPGTPHPFKPNWLVAAIRPLQPLVPLSANPKQPNKMNVAITVCYLDATGTQICSQFRAKGANKNDLNIVRPHEFVVVDNPALG